MIIEHPFQTGWKLVETPKPMETTDSLYRFRDSIPAGKVRTLTVKEEMVQGETIAILPADLGQLESYSRSGEIPAVVRAALIKTMGLKSAVLDTQRQIQQRQKELSDISQEQKRIRDNMNTVTQNSQYYTRLLGKLNDQESRIEKLQVEIERLQQTHDQQRKDLDTYLVNTTVG
jgi:predicted RNase H-like nuclease (RuvC/YqgF family)